ncbi:glycosyltransferase family 9 protein [Photobacterium swingsii]|uniref:glycosyltransferase family 9 protein n=1 Tax=Photobacterium swingsii TaxID=680026 RepID=UPI0035526229
MALFSSPPSSICILRLSAIGDVCNASAMVNAIQQQWPKTHITWVMGAMEAKLLGDLPNVTVIPFDKKSGFKGYLALWKTLKGQRFDALLHMQTALRASIASIGIRATHKLGFDKTRRNDLQQLFINHSVPSPTSPHVLDGFMQFAFELGVSRCEPSWNIQSQPVDMDWAHAQLSTSKPNLVIVPGASKAYKNWTAQGYAAVADYAESKGFHIVLAGSPASVETELAQHVCQHSKATLVNLVGKSSLTQMQALLQQADLVIAPDTGPAHMAVAANTPVIGLYAHHNPARTGPYLYRDYVVSAYKEAIEAETGKDITQLSWRSRVKDKHAMQRIQSDTVITMLDKAVADFKLIKE